MRKLPAEDADPWLPCRPCRLAGGAGKTPRGVPWLSAADRQARVRPTLHPKGGASDLVQETFLDAQRGLRRVRRRLGGRAAGVAPPPAAE